MTNHLQPLVFLLVFPDEETAFQSHTRSRMRGPGRGGVEAVRGGLARLRASRAAVVLLVYAALVLDNMLLTVLGKPHEGG